jgi:uncharacterized protein (DUF924 family)
MDESLSVREFWFGPLGRISDTRLAGLARVLSERSSVWFSSQSDTQQEMDAAIRSQFGPLLERASRGALAGWADSPRRRLSLIILLDQFPRQIHRGTARAFAYDAEALDLTLTGMQAAADAALNVAERIFFYMPLQHAESIEAQEESVGAYRRLLAEAPNELQGTLQDALESAEAHREIIRQFGRFPHRNQALQRANTAAETAYLNEHPHGFGQ